MLELVVMTPVMIALLLLVVGFGRVAETRQQVESAASDAARAASLQRDQGLSADAARRAAKDSIERSEVICAGLDVDVDLSNYQPGGDVTVTVSCRAELGDMVLSGMPGSRTLSSTRTVPIETYRGS
ncbi:TadE/TadG family type IV pilus assembly protein [Nocardioides zeae]